MSPARAAPAVRFEATLYTIDGSTILRLPEKASNQLPSRGQVAVQAAVNGHACRPSSNRTASPATGCGSTRSNSGPLRSAPGTPWKSCSCPSRTGRNQRCHVIFRPRSLRRRTGSRSCEGHHADGVLGVGSVGECDPESRHAPAPRRSQHLEDAEREAPAVLFQPGRVHRPGPFEEREADRSAMIGLAYAVSEPCGPWEVSLG